MKKYFSLPLVSCCLLLVVLCLSACEKTPKVEGKLEVFR